MLQRKVMKKYCVLFCVLFLGMPVCGLAATISGTVSLDGGGYPGEGDISFTLFDQYSGADGACDAMAMNTTVTYNSADGTYTLTGVAVGSYYLQVDADSGANLVAEWAAGANGSSVEDCTAAVPLYIAGDADALSDYNFQLASGGTISGVVKDGSGSTILPSIFVNVYQQSGTDDGCSKANKLYRRTSSAGDGTFTVTGLPLDTQFFVKADSYGEQNYIPEWSAGPSASTPVCDQAISFSMSTAIPSVSAAFFLDDGSSISGTVEDSDGNPLQGASFTLNRIIDPLAPCSFDWTESLYPLPSSGVDGSYTVRGIAPGVYTIQAAPESSSFLREYWADSASVSACAKAGVITVLAGGEVHSGKDFQLDAGSGIMGVITDASGTVEGSYVVVTAIDTCDMSFGEMEGFTLTAADGSYTFANLPVGQHYVYTYEMAGVYLPEYWDNVHDWAAQTPVTITTPGQVVGGISMELDLATSITGSITREDATSLTVEELSHLRVMAYPDTGNPCYFADTVQGVIDSSTGTYVVPGLAPGNYLVAVTSDGEVNYMPEYSVGATSVSMCLSLAGNVSLPVYGDTVGGVDFQIEAGSTIEGTVSRDDRGTFTLDDYIVSLISPVPADSGTVCEGITTIGSVQVKADGSYLIAGLPPGNFSVTVSSNPWFSDLPDVVNEWATGESVDSSSDCASAEIITISAANSLYSNRNFQVDSGGKVSGHVLEHNGTTLSDGTYSVRFHTSCDMNGWEYDAVNMCGGYLSPAMESGDFYISLWAGDGQTFLGWWSQSGALVSDCTAAQTITVLQEETLPSINFTLDRNGSLVPIYMLLLKSPVFQ